MRDKPDAQELLETARRLLLEELLPELPPEKRYSGLMIAAAMAIAAREAEAGEAPLMEEHDALAAIYGGGAPLEELNRRFAADLRGGRFDDEPEAALVILRASALHRVRESNPKYLEGDD